MKRRKRKWWLPKPERIRTVAKGGCRWWWEDGFELVVVTYGGGGDAWMG